MGFVSLKNITFSYDNKETVFSNFNMEIEKGGFCIVEGENGSGKTTLFRILNGLSFPQNGKYIFDGQEITNKYLSDNKNMKYFHKRIGYLFQNPDIMLFNNNVYEEIAFGPRQMKLSENEIKKRVSDCMAMFGLEKLADKASYHLSGGQKKRVALASVLSLNPEVLTLDEPFDSLDKKNKEVLLEILKDLKENGKTIILASHGLEEIKKLTDKQVLLT